MPPATRKVAASKKKKQTRLAFDPVGAPVSATKEPSPAKVRYERSQGGGLSSMLPIQSSGTIAEDDSDDDILFSSSIATTSRSAKSKKDGKLPFKPIISNKSTRQVYDAASEDTLEDEIANDFRYTLHTPTSSARKSNSTPASRRRRISVEVDIDSSDGSAPEEYATPSKPRRNRISRSSAQKPQTLVELSSDSEAVMLPPSKVSKEPTTRHKPSRSRASAQKSLREDSDSDSDDVVPTQPARRFRTHLTALGVDDDDDSDDPISSPLKRTRQVVESDDSDDVLSPLKRRRQVTANSDDEDAPKSSVELEKSATPTRTTRQSRVRRHRTDKEKKLELLKRRRAGETIEELTESSQSESDSDESDFQKLSEFEDDEEEDELIIEKPRKPVKKARSNDDDDDLDSVEDFIADDDELGVPDPSLLDIPLQFTHHAHKPLKEHFKDAVEWMVHKKINPGFARDDPLYIQAFKKLDDEYGGYAKSKFVSSQWTAEFTRAIYARPEFLVRDLAPGEEITIAGQVICQVCNHRKYIPKYEIQFAGKAYHVSTLDEIEADSDDEDSERDDDDSDRRSINADGHELPPTSQTWLSGQYCKANAEQAHSLIHWKYALNQWVLDTLEFEGHLTPEKLAEREKMKAKQRRKYANDIVDDWERHHQIKDLYRDFKINLETARESTSGSWANGRFRR